MNNNLALYIHYPYCVNKCPYCDFNSDVKPYEDKGFDDMYLRTVKKEFDLFVPYLEDRKFVSIFFGGGTPSLANAAFIRDLVKYFEPYTQPNAEITVEANPGTAHTHKFKAYRDCGVNRMSIGVQSFNDKSLERLGRIHTGEDGRAAVRMAQQLGFSNINIDIIHGIPGQTVESSLEDLRQAVDLDPAHISWYELTIEENTEFGRHPPELPPEEVLEEIEETGFHFLNVHNYMRYEVSAFCRDNIRCVHNQNYWQFGDYIGLGAGAHSKMSFIDQTLRRNNVADPRAYIEDFTRNKFARVPDDKIPFEYMLNRLRLFDPILKQDFKDRTSLDFSLVEDKLQKASRLGLINWQKSRYSLTAKGRMNINAIVKLFM